MQTLFRRILVPYDFSPHATRALGVALELARRERGRVTVLHAIPRMSRVIGVPPGVFPPAILSAALPDEQLRRVKARVAHALRGKKGPPVTCRVIVAEPLAAILDAARQATAIVMGTLGLTGLPHLVIGSVAEKVVRHATIPVLTIRAGSRRRARRASRRRRRAARAPDGAGLRTTRGARRARALARAPR